MGYTGFMEPFSEILQAGGHANSLGRANEVFELLQKDASRLDELFDCISHEDAWVRMRAIDTFEKLVRQNPKLALHYLEGIFNDLTKSDQPSIQWHLAEIFTEVELTDTQRVKAIEWLKNNLKTVSVDWIVAANTMKALLHFYKLGHAKADELLRLFQVQTEHHSKAVRKKATTSIETIEAYNR